MKATLACTRTIAVAALMMTILTGQALATNITWDFQRVSTATGGPPFVSVGMRTGSTWPTVFYDRSGLKAGSLTPAGWSEFALGAASGNGSTARAHAGPDGRVGVAWFSSSNEVRFSQSSRYGWQSSSVGPTYTTSYIGGPDFAYLSNNQPVVAYMGSVGTKNGLALSSYDGLGWNTDLIDKVMVGTQVRPVGEAPTIAIDSQDRIGLAFRYGSEIIFAQQDLSQATWYGTSLGSPFQISSSAVLSLAYGANDTAAMAIKSGNYLLVSHFDIQSGAWVTEQLSTTVASQRVNLAFNSQGHPAVAYVDTDRSIHYRVNTGGGWVDVMLPKGTDPVTGLIVDPYATTDAALAFDRFDNPVIAYVGTAGLMLAYDPVAPEPASLLMVVVGLAMLRPRRR